MYNVLLHACKMYTPHLPCYIRERRKERNIYIHIYMRKREERGYVNLPLIKLYLNSQIRERSSIFPIVCIKNKRMYLSAV